MRAASKIVISVLLLCGLLVVVPQASASTTYEPPFTTVIQGGDFANVRNVQQNEGRITILRAGMGTPGSGQLPGFSCPGAGGFARFRLTHTVTEPISSVTFSYADTALGPYTWILTSVSGGAKWWGATQKRGPLAGDGIVTVPLVSPGPEIGTTLTIDFGLEVSSACPNAEGGTVRFTEVTLS